MLLLRYLQQVLPLVEGVPRARCTLLNFLSRSHMHWLYANDVSLTQHPPSELLHRADGLLTPATSNVLRDGEVRDGSTGRTPVSSAVAAPTAADHPRGNGWLA